ncbi:MAG: hypothetical protein GX620_10070 [Chloroflexi bacterium]|nr:hypothetical protein [Chloroflexota bacterium]
METQRRMILCAFTVLALAVLACSNPGTMSTPPPVQPTAPLPAEVATLTPVPTAEPTVTLSPPNEPPSETPRSKGEQAAIEVINGSSSDVWHLYVSPTESDSWGADWLGDTIIAAGDSFVVANLPPGEYDLRAEGETGSVIGEQWSFAVSGRETWVIGAEGSVELINYSGTVVTDLYISPWTSDTWGDNWLDDDVLAPDTSYTIEGIDSGIYDIQVRDASDTIIQTWHRVDVAPGTHLEVSGRAPLPRNAVQRLNENFDDNRNRWGDFEEPEVEPYSPANGEYCLRVVPGDWVGWEYYTQLSTTAFLAELTCSYPESDAACALGYFADASNYYWFEVAAYSQAYALYALIDGEWRSIVEWTSSYVIDPTGYNGLAMERTGDTIRLYINGIPVQELEDDLIHTGWIGVGGATFDDVDVTFCMDHVRIWELE